MSAYLPPSGYVIDQILASLAGSYEYMSWAPQSYWDSLEPGVVEYESWQLPQNCLKENP